MDIVEQHLVLYDGKLVMTFDEYDKFRSKAPLLAIASKNHFNHNKLKYEIKMAVFNSDRYSVEVQLENTNNPTGINLADFERNSLALGVFNIPDYVKFCRYPKTVNYEHSNVFTLERIDSELKWFVNDDLIETFDYYKSDNCHGVCEE